MEIYSQKDSEFNAQRLSETAGGGFMIQNELVSQESNEERPDDFIFNNQMDIVSFDSEGQQEGQSEQQGDEQ